MPYLPTILTEVILYVLWVTTNVTFIRCFKWAFPLFLSFFIKKAYIPFWHKHKTQAVIKKKAEFFPCTTLLHYPHTIQLFIISLQIKVR